MSVTNKLPVITPLDHISVFVTRVFMEMDFTVQVGFLRFIDFVESHINDGNIGKQTCIEPVA